MTTAEVATMVSSFGITNWRYDHFSETPAPPYVVYFYPSENDVFADDSNYVNRRQLFIELYTKQKDATNEAAIEAKLASNGLTWYKQTDFLDDEKLYQTVYECEVIING